MSASAPVFLCKKCLSQNFVWYVNCLVCNHSFDEMDKTFKVTRESSIRGISKYYYSPQGFPVENRETHVVEEYEPKNDKILVTIVSTDVPAIDRFTDNETLQYDLHNEREKNEKLKMYFSWLGFSILLGIVYFYI